MNHERQAPSIGREFLVIWIGQTVSMLGTGLGSFALGVWLYETTGSTTQFALMAFTAAIATFVLAPFGGIVADRYDRRWVMVLSDAGSGLMTLAMAFMLYTDRLEPWHVYPIVFVMVGFQAFQGPAFQASVSMLVPRNQLGRASGMAQVSGSLAGIIAPVAAGFLVLAIGYHGVILMDFVTFLVAVATLVSVRIPRPKPLGEVGEDASEKERAEAKRKRSLAYGWQYIRQRPGLLSLLVLFALTNFILGFVQILFVPLVLGFSSPAGLGTVESAAAAGGLIGSLVLSVWGGPKVRVWGIFGALIVQGLVLFLGGLQPSVALVAIAGFLMMFAVPIINGLSQAIWQSKVAHAIQGRVFAIRRMVVRAAAPIAYLVAGPLAEQIFKPLLDISGPLATTFVGRVVGVGPSRGVGLLFIALGVVVILATVLCFMNPRLRRVEEELPDADAADEKIPEVPPGRDPSPDLQEA